MKKYIKILLLPFIFYSFQSNATIVPRSIGGEDRIKVINYAPNAVFRYVGHYYYQTTIEFSSDEEIKSILMGTPTPWQIIPSGNKIFLKPIEEDATTNMTVTTIRKRDSSERNYFFEMHARNADNINDPELAFIIKFVYPDEIDYTTAQNLESYSGPDLTKPELYNFNYKISGIATGIEPVQIFDDGRFTYFKFREFNRELPAIFLVKSDRSEALINYRVDKGYVVVEGVARRYTLRYAKQVICVFNESLIP